MPADPIRDRRAVEAIKSNLLEQGRLRDHALFVCGLNWALRVSDLTKIRVADVRGTRGLRNTLELVQEKTRKAVRVPMTDGCREALERFLSTPGDQGGHPDASADAPLFPSRERTPQGQLKPLTRQQVHRIIKASCGDVLPEQGTWATHTLRKTWGYHAYKVGAPLAVIQRKLGHRRPSVTLDYLGLTDDDVRDWSERVEL